MFPIGSTSQLQDSKRQKQNELNDNSEVKSYRPDMWQMTQTLQKITWEPFPRREDNVAEETKERFLCMLAEENWCSIAELAFWKFQNIRRGCSAARLMIMRH
jgi:hypothetical protein